MGTTFVAKEFVSASAVCPRFDECAVALNGTGEVIDGFGVIAVSEHLDVSAVVPGLFVVAVDVKDLFVDFFGFVRLVEVLIVHGETIKSVGVIWLDAKGSVEIFYGHRVALCGVEHAEFFKSGFVVGIEVADFAQQDDGIVGVASFFVNKGFHKQCRAVLWVFGGDFAEVVHGTVVVAAVVCYFSQFEKSFLTVGFQFKGLLKAFVTVFHITVGKICIAKKEVVFVFFFVEGNGMGEVGDGLIDSVEFEIYVGAVVI